VVRTLRERLWEVLQVQLEDQRNAWQMQPDGSYVRLHAERAPPKSRSKAPM
jgi:polyphosphate kinase